MATYRRSYERYLIEDSAQISTAEEQAVPLILRDLSARGAGIIGNFPFELNKEVVIKFKVPYLIQKVICKHARIVWCSQINENLWRAGLDFGLINKYNRSPN